MHSVAEDLFYDFSIHSFISADVQFIILKLFAITGIVKLLIA